MFGWRKKTKATPAQVEEIPRAASAEIGAAESADQYLSDQPITRRSMDRFNRAPFASRIADTIARRVDPSSIVIGLFGPWGDGKTSVLEMMEEALAQSGNVIVVRFNPWHFQAEDLLLRGFFATLADGLGKSLPNLKEKAGELFKKYGGLLSLGSLSLGAGIVQLNPGTAAKELGDALSTVGLDELKQRIERLLADSGKRLVILIDDIDRLDRSDTHSIFKLVKLSASFKHTCYVLAFDDEVVSAALGERYGAGGQDAGRAFLEKIIQVPLHLPPADTTSLRRLALEGVESALKQADISLEGRQVDAFLRHFVDGLEPALETPRLAKLYSNALSFALPLLKGEVDVVDLMLVEGIRVFYPRLYAGIRDNPDVFLSHRENGRRDAEAQVNALDELLAASLTGSTKNDRDRIKDRLLKPMFPRVGTMIYGGEWDSVWAKKQKICSTEYFRRFFTYGVPEGDVADAKVEAFIREVVSSDPDQQRSLLQEFVQRNAMPRLISKLRDCADNLEPVEATAIMEAIARNADLLPRERGPMSIGGTMLQGGILISQLLRRVATTQRQHVAENIVQIAEPLGFGLECLRWMQHSEDRPEERRVLSDEGELSIKDLLAQRVSAADNASPLYLRFPKDCPSLYWLWRSSGAELAVTAALESRLAAVPDEVDAFLDCFVGEGWEMESGLPVRSSLNRRNYDSISELVSSDFIVANLRARYGVELDEPQYHPAGEFSIARKIAHQFMAIHNQVAQEEATRRAGGAAEDGASSPDH